MAQSDVIFFGEYHNSSVVHWLERVVFTSLADRLDVYKRQVLCCYVTMLLQYYVVRVLCCYVTMLLQCYVRCV